MINLNVPIMMREQETWREVKTITGCTTHRAKSIIISAREAVPYPRTYSSEGVAYDVDLAVVVVLKLAFEQRKQQ